MDKKMSKAGDKIKSFFSKKKAEAKFKVNNFICQWILNQFHNKFFFS